MSEEYLWDRSGDPDPEIADLEQALAPLKFEGLPLIAISKAEPSPASGPSDVRRWWPAAVTAATAVAMLPYPVSMMTRQSGFTSCNAATTSRPLPSPRRKSITA